MAYNPFDFFRRNQKIMFSALTIVIMFMFVFSFGQNDFFSWFPRWLGGKKSRGEVLAVIDGDKFQVSEATQIRQRRSQANQYMTSAAEKARTNLLAYSKDNASKVSAEYRSAVTGVVENYQFGSMLDRLPQQQQQQFLQQNQQLYLSYFTYKTSLRKLDGLFRNANAAPDDLDVANAVRKYMLLTEMSSLPDRHYFLNQPNRSAKDAIEYTSG